MWIFRRCCCTHLFFWGRGLLTGRTIHNNTKKVARPLSFLLPPLFISQVGSFRERTVSPMRTYLSSHYSSPLILVSVRPWRTDSVKWWVIHTEQQLELRQKAHHRREKKGETIVPLHHEMKPQQNNYLHCSKRLLFRIPFLIAWHKNN